MYLLNFSAVNILGCCGNSIFVMVARYFRADDCMGAGVRATRATNAEGEILCGINERLSGKITQRGREKWISESAPRLFIAALSFAVLSLLWGCEAKTPAQMAPSIDTAAEQTRISEQIPTSIELAPPGAAQAMTAQQVRQAVERERDENNSGHP